MISAVATLQPALEKFYGLLSDEQKARLTALGNDRQQKRDGADHRLARTDLQYSATWRDGVADSRN